MKLNKFIFFVTCLSLVACKADVVDDNQEKTEESTNIENNSVNENSDSQNNNNDENSSHNEEENGKNETETLLPIIANSKWGIDAAKACYNTLGTVIPFMEADAFEFKETEDDFGDPAIWFYLYYETDEIAEAKIEDYAWAAYEQDRYECEINPEYTFYDETSYVYWKQQVLFADKKLASNRAVEIMALTSIKPYEGVEKPCLGLFCSNYVPNIDPNSFPENAVEEILGKKNGLPTLSTVNDVLTYSFTYFMHSGIKCLEIAVRPKTMSYTLEESYFYELLKACFTVVQFDELEDDFTDNRFYGSGNVYPEFEDNLYYYALSAEEDYMLTFDYNLNYNIFYIDIMPTGF